MPTIVSPDGTTLPFDRARLEASLRRRGLDPELAGSVAHKLEELLERAPGGIAIDQMNPLVGEALLDLARAPAHDEIARGEVPRAEPPRAVARPHPTPPPLPHAAPPSTAGLPHATDPRRELGIDPWYAFRRALGLPAEAGNEASPTGMAFPAARVTKTVYANDTSQPRTVCLGLAYSGRVELELPGGRRVALEGVGREVRDIEVPPGASVLVRGVHEPYSVVRWSLH